VYFYAEVERAAEALTESAIVVIGS
jgi:hypothetical protein